MTRKRSRRYPAKTITDADYTDDIAILANTLGQAETLLYSLKRAAAGIGLYVNAHKTEYMCYNQTGDSCTLDGTPLKLVDKFTYLGSSVASAEKDIDTRLTKAWTAINRLSIIWKSDLTDKMKRSFFQAAVASILLYGCTTWTLTKRLEKKCYIVTYVDSHLHTCTYICRIIHSDTTIKTHEGRHRKTSLTAYLPLTLFVRFACERVLETEHKLHILTSTTYDRHVVSFLFPWCSTRGRGLTLLNAGFLYGILSASSLDP